jgi:hypothetical protein
MNKIKTKIVDPSGLYNIVRVDETSPQGVQHTDYVVHELDRNGKRITVRTRTPYLRAERAVIGNADLYPGPQRIARAAAAIRAEENRRNAHAHQKSK